MKVIVMHLLLAVAIAALAGCGSEDSARSASPSGSATAPGPEPAVDSAAGSGQAAGTPAIEYPEASRTREGNGGVVAVAGELTAEFDYAPPQGRCNAADGKFSATGAGIEDNLARVSITHEPIVDPNTGRQLGEAFMLEVRPGDSTPWAWMAHVGTGLAGSVEAVSQSPSPGGGVTLVATGVVAGSEKNGAPTGAKLPFRLEATCGDPAQQ